MWMSLLDVFYGRCMNIFKEKRVSLKLTQKDFAKLLDIPLSRISKIENGILDLDTACAFCNAFKNEFKIEKMRVVKNI